ncbi:MAG: T9SS type A sorting domain-containing protein [Cytophagales bacterium]|nr:T9SS type A sorting domain-containing protein [Cytophagales bacterium]MDW8383231.1 T9SS type A sorting domain-containing protein [Flammeovirgaceae bacterium]
MKISTQLMLVLLMLGQASYAQLNTWIRVNEGFAKCASIHNGNDANLGGEAEQTVDDFTVEQLLSRRGEVYAYVTYGNAGSNPTACNGGLFKHDTVRNLWLKVADLAQAPSYVFTNGTDIFITQGNNILRYTTNYTSFPNGWQTVVSNLKGNEIPGMSCIDNINFGEYTHLRFPQAVGDTIYAWAFNPCGNSNRIVKFYVGGSSFNKATDISVTVVGTFPDEGLPQTCNTSSTGGISSYIVTAPIGGLFQYFFQRAFHGRDYSIPFYVWVYEPRNISWTDPVTKATINGPGWRNISQGPDWKNATGNSNPVNVNHPDFVDFSADICDPGDWTSARSVNGSGSIIPQGPSGKIIISDDRTRLFASSENGVYEWIGSGWVYRAARRENSELYFTKNGFFQIVRLGLNRVDGPNTQEIGQPEYYGTCLQNKPVTHLTSPDEGRTLYAVRRIFLNDPTCTGSTEDEGIYRLVVDIDGPATVRNIGVESATFLGDSTNPSGHNEVVNTGVAGNMNHFVAGNFAGVTSPYPYATYNLPATAQFPAAVSSTRAKILQFNARGDSIIRVINVGTAVNDTIHDFEVMNNSPFRMVVSGTFGFRVLDSLGNLLWGRNRNQCPGSIYEAGSAERPAGSILCDISNDQSIVILRGKTWRRWNANGTDSSGTHTFTDNYVEDVTIKNDTAFFAGFNNSNLGGVPNSCGETASLPVQFAFIKRFKANLGNASPTQVVPNTFGIDGNLLGLDQADTRGYRINVGQDGKLYFMGEAAGGNSIFRWNGRTSVELGADGTQGTGDDCNTSLMSSVRKLVESDQFSQPFNTSAAHLAYFATINPNTGLVEKGQYIIPRNQSNGVGNSYRVKDGYIHADKDGYVYIAGASACCVNGTGRDIQKVNGQPIAPYTGEDMALLIVSPTYRTKTFWGVFAKGTAGRGRGVGIGIRDTTLSFVGRVTAGNMHTRKPIIANPINPADNSIFDSYLAVWYRDIWKTSKRDSIIETVLPGDSVVPPDELKFNARFSISNKTPCVATGTVNFTDKTFIPSGWTVTSRLWEFGSGASPATSTAANPTGIVYNTTGLKTPRLTITIQKGSETRTSSSQQFYKDSINVVGSGYSLGPITGETQVCPNYECVYSINPPEPGVFSITSYTWTVPAGATILSGQGSKSIRVKWGSTGGMVSVSASFGCATPATSNLSVTVSTTPPATQAFMLVNSLVLTAAETKIRNILQGMGYNVTIKEDNNYTINDATCKALVVISNTNDTSLVDTAFRSLPSKMVVMDSRLFGKLNMTSSQGTTTGQTQLNISTSNGVPATYTGLNGGVPTGNQVAVTSASAFGWGVPAASATHIASILSSSNRVIFAYDAGATMVGGAIAPELRIGLGFSAAAVNNANALGDSLIFRALCFPNNTCTQPTITTTKIDSVACYGDSLTIRIQVSGTINPGNVYTVELSNSAGSFANPTILGTFTSTSLDTFVKVLIPSSLTPCTSGNCYSIRTKSSAPNAVGTSTPRVYVVAPEPFKIIVVGNASGTSNKVNGTPAAVSGYGSDQALLDSLRAWYGNSDTVVYIDGDASAGVTQADFKCKGLVIITSNATGKTTWGRALDGLNTPIIFMGGEIGEGAGFGGASNYTYELGVGQAGRTDVSSQSTIRIYDNTHPLTIGVNTGDIPASLSDNLEAGITFFRFLPFQGANIKYLAGGRKPTTTFNPTFFYYDKGDTLYANIDIIDLENASFSQPNVKAFGTWTTEGSTDNRFGSNAYRTNNPPTAGDSVRFAYIPRVPGVYEIFVGSHRSSNDCNDAKVRVRNSLGNTVFSYNQESTTTASYNIVKVGDFNLPTDTTYVTIFQSGTCGSGKVLKADMLWVQRKTTAPARRVGFPWTQRHSVGSYQGLFNNLHPNMHRLMKNSVCWATNGLKNRNTCQSIAVITTGELIVNANDTLCGAEGTRITFTSTLDSFNVGNVFTVQLSDASGSFASPTTIGTLASRVPDTIKLEIPESLVSGGNYKVRVVSSNPPVIGSVSSFNQAYVRIDNSDPNPLVGLYSDPYSAPSGVNNTFPSGTVGRIGSNMMHLTTSDVVFTQGARFTPSLPVAGIYAVQAYIPDTVNTSSSPTINNTDRATFRVTYGGLRRDIHVDVTNAANRGKWVTIGAFPFTTSPSDNHVIIGRGRSTGSSDVFATSNRLSGSGVVPLTAAFFLNGTLDSSGTQSGNGQVIDAIRFIPIANVTGPLLVDSVMDNPTTDPGVGTHSFTVTNGRVIIQNPTTDRVTTYGMDPRVNGNALIFSSMGNVPPVDQPNYIATYRFGVPTPGSYWLYRFNRATSDFCSGGGQFSVQDSVSTHVFSGINWESGGTWRRAMNPSTPDGSWRIKDTLTITITGLCSESSINTHIPIDGWRLVSVPPVLTIRVDSQAIRIVGGVNTWLGHDTVWNKRSNWTCRVPDRNTDILIPASPVGGNFPSITLPAEARSVRNRGTLRLRPGADLAVTDSFNNQGTVISNTGSMLRMAYNLNTHASSKVRQPLISTTPLTLNGLGINSDSGVSLQTNLTLNSSLSFTKGKLYLNDKKLTLDSTLSISGDNASNYVVTPNQVSETGAGFVRRRVRMGGTDAIFPIGNDTTYAPVTLRNTGTRSVDFEVRTFQGVYSNGLSGTLLPASQIINRTWQIDPYYLNTADSGLPSIEIVLSFTNKDTTPNFVFANAYISNNRHIPGDNTWKQMLDFAGYTFNTAPSGTGTEADPYRLAVGNVRRFSVFGVGSGSSPLPVVLTHFRGVKEGNDAILTWGTSTEYELAGFGIERSYNQADFEEIGFVEAKNAGRATSYRYIDPSIQYDSYYRLKIYTNGGKVQYSHVVFVPSGKQAKPSFVIYPNPTKGSVTLQYTGKFDESGNVLYMELMDVTGKRIGSASGTVASVNDALNKMLPAVSKGMYIVALRWGDDTQQIKIVKD